MSAKCWGKLMNFGPVRLGKLVTGRMWDTLMAGFRRLGDIAALRPQRQACHFFILQMYITQGETLPDVYIHKYASRRRRRLQGEESCDSSGDDDFVDDIANGELDTDISLQLLGDRSMWTRYFDSGCATAIAQLPRRTLPPGNAKQLYEEMVHCWHPSSQKHPALNTFYRAWEEWNSALAFRSVSHFADCDVCHRLRETIARSTSVSEKASAVKEQLLHHGIIAKCRRIEESLRSSPPEDLTLPVLVMWTDGMDQAHWSIPREAGSNAPRDWAKYQRPRCKVQGCWLFWHEVTFYFADHCMPHDASMTCEVIAQSLERVKAIALERGEPVPPELIVWTDNTPRENKNSIVLAYLIFLVAKGMFRMSALMNFQKGHSHGILAGNEICADIA
jgi:hypothetical protein